MSPARRKRYVAYYRVSTDRQGKSGLGLEAQQTTVRDYINGAAEIVAAFVEIETGKRADRPELAKAIEACRRYKATLVISKLDRLARNVKFLLTLLDSGVDVAFCDLPGATGAMGRFLVTQMAAVAELEAGLISERTKAALAVAKQRIAVTGQKKHPHVKRLGNPRAAKALVIGRAALKVAADRRAANVLPIIRAIQDSGIKSPGEIAEALNARNVPTARGRQWSRVQVARVLARSPQEAEPAL